LRRVLIRALGLPVLLPSVLYSTGYGAMVPVVAISARGLGGSIAVASLVAGCLGAGTMLFDIPAGKLAGRFGERHAMIAATAVSIAAIAAYLAASSVAVLALAMLVIGAAMSVWGLSRQAYVTESTPAHARARALSLLACTHRVGLLIGPFLGAGVIGLVGLRGPFYVHLALAAATLVVLSVIKDPDGASRSAAKARGTRPSTRALLLNHRVVLTRLGLCVMMLGALRASRDSLLPLWAHHIGLSATQISLASGILSALELTLFYPAGIVMDRKGRAFVAVPCVALMALSHVLLPFSHSFGQMIAAITAMGIGNGLGMGISMTIGGDVAPENGRYEFLGIWRLFNDVGSLGGPVLVSAVAALSSLWPAALVLGAGGAAAAGALSRWIPRLLPNAGHR